MARRLLSVVLPLGLVCCGLDVVGTRHAVVSDADAATEPKLVDASASAPPFAVDPDAAVQDDASAADAGADAPPACLPKGAACTSSSMCCSGLTCDTDLEPPACATKS